jgi:hypothetical protein
VANNEDPQVVSGRPRRANSVHLTVCACHCPGHRHVGTLGPCPASRQAYSLPAPVSTYLPGLHTLPTRHDVTGGVSLNDTGTVTGGVAMRALVVSLVMVLVMVSP